MRNRSVLVAAVAMVSLLAGCESGNGGGKLFGGGGSSSASSVEKPQPAAASKSLLDQYLAKVTDLGNYLKDVKDPPAARAALPGANERVDALRTLANRVESLDAQERVLLGTNYTDKLNQTIAKFEQSTRQIRDNPQLLKIMEPALSRLPALGF